jgi:hypothetical protein
MIFKQSLYFVVIILLGITTLTSCRRTHVPQITTEAEYARANPIPIEQLTPEQKAIRQITIQSRSIKTLQTQMEIVLRRRSVPLIGNGYFYYQQAHNFRLVNKSIRTGQLNSDVGGNAQGFWFYVRRLHSDTIYTCDWTRQSQSNLPDSINPLFILEILNLDLNYSNAKSRIEGNLLIVTEFLPGGSEKATVIDLKKPAVIAIHLRNNGRMISKTQVQSFININGIYIPANIQADWYEENIKIEWHLSRHRLNEEISGNQFQIPNLRLKVVDVGRTKVDFSQER